MTGVALGVHCSIQPDGRYTADGNVAVLVNGEPRFAVAQERVTRRKYDGGFAEAARYTLDRLGLTTGDVDAVAVSTFGRPDRQDDEEQAAVGRTVAAALGTSAPCHVVASHHLAHAALAAATATQDRALVAVIDNEGSILGRRQHADLWRHGLERTSYYVLDEDRLTLVARDHAGPGEVGYGKAYSKVTRYVGFRSYQQAGKTMALAAFGERRRFGSVRLFEADAAGIPRTRLRNSEDGLRDLAEFFRDAGRPLPPPRGPGEPLDSALVDLAAWCQAELETSVCERVRSLSAEHRVRPLCGAGGVFLNSVMNRRLQDTLDSDEVFVPPAPGDTGLALGALAWWQWTTTGRRPRWPASPYLGGEFTADEVRAAARGQDAVVVEQVHDPVVEAVRDLADGQVVGWFRGRSEHGPRALGNRSILARPGPWSREVLNNLVKHREWFRPYAPIVAEERAAELFEMRAPVPFMMHVAPARPEAISLLPGGVHVDCTARLQTVSAAQNPDMHRLVTLFGQATGVPALINTSLNVDGMPIVEKPADAVECFLRASGMDVMMVGPDLKLTRSKAIS